MFAHPVVVHDLSLSIAAEPFDSPDARRLVAALDAGLAELYPPEQRFGPNLKAEHLEDGRGAFLVARDGDRAVGCGAIRLIDPTTAEAKRMYVEPDHRGRGSGAVLAGLEAAAGRLGVSGASCSRRAFTRGGDLPLSPRRLHSGRLLGRVRVLAHQHLLREEPLKVSDCFSDQTRHRHRRRSGFKMAARRRWLGRGI